jgi:hypothetical protein
LWAWDRRATQPSSVNDLDPLGESAEDVLERVKARLATNDRARMKKAARSYGAQRDKRVFARARAELRAL